MKHMEGKGHNTFKSLWMSILLLVILYLAITTVSIVRFGRIDQKQKADVAIVLGAGTANDAVSPVFAERINHGIWLYQNHYVNAILFTGGIGGENAHSDAYIAKQYAMAKGIPEEDIFLEETSTITQENIANAKAVMEANSMKNAIIVSDPLHMRRAMLMAEDYGLESYSSPTPTSRYVTWKSKLPFLAREEFFYAGYRIYRIFR